MAAESASSTTCSSNMSNEVIQLNILPECDRAARERMLARIAAGKVHVKSQQRGEDELSLEDKFSILSELLDDKPTIFLERFHTLLQDEDLEVFNHLSGDYEINFYLKEARKRLRIGKSGMGVKNRRYEALKQLEKEGTYFADQAMKDRDPLMFEEYVGQYMTEEERKSLLKPIDSSDLKFSSILMTFMDEQETKQLHKMQKEAEDDMMEEEEEDEDEEGDEEEYDSDEDGAAETSSSQRQVLPSKHLKQPVKEEPTPASEEEKALMRQEFLHHMHQRFLGGQERDFDYSTVDGNAEYDSLALRTQDEEEHYFDDEEEETWSLEEAERRRESDGDQDYCDFDVNGLGATPCESMDDTVPCTAVEKNLCVQNTQTDMRDDVNNAAMES